PLTRGSAGKGARSGAHHRGEPGRRQLHEIASIGSHLLFSVAGCLAGGSVFRGSFSGRIAVLYAKVAVTTAIWMRSSRWMRSTVSILEWWVRELYSSRSCMNWNAGMPTASKDW